MRCPRALTTGVPVPPASSGAESEAESSLLFSLSSSGSGGSCFTSGRLESTAWERWEIGNSQKSKVGLRKESLIGQPVTVLINPTSITLQHRKTICLKNFFPFPTDFHFFY